MTDDEIKAAFEVFITSISDGHIVTDAIMVMSLITPDQWDDDTTTYQLVTYGKASIHRCIGLLEVAKDEMLHGGEL